MHRAFLGGVSLGSGRPVAVMGALNVSPESFHAGSVHRIGEDLLVAAHAMVEAGAALIDVGARSTAPYRATAVGEAEEAERLERAIGLLAPKVSVPLSAEGGLKEHVKVAMSRLERDLVSRALKQTNNNVTHAARLLKISRKGLQLKMKELGLREREGTPDS